MADLPTSLSTLPRDKQSKRHLVCDKKAESGGAVTVALQYLFGAGSRMFLRHNGIVHIPRRPDPAEGGF